MHPDLPSSRPVRAALAAGALGWTLAAALLAGAPADPHLGGPAHDPGGGWVVELVQGQTFETRYQPTIDPRRPGTVHLLTAHGNPISLPRSLIRSIRARPVAGGRWLDGETIVLGVVPQLGRPPGEAPPGESNDPAAAFRRRLLAALETAPYTVEQFVEPSESRGIPLPYRLGAVPEAGSPWRFLTAQDRP